MQSPPLQLSPLSADKLVKCCKGNDVWAFAMVEASDSVTPTEIPPVVQSLMTTYSDLFHVPTTLPPSRVHDLSLICATLACEAKFVEFYSFAQIKGELKLNLRIHKELLNIFFLSFNRFVINHQKGGD